MKKLILLLLAGLLLMSCKKEVATPVDNRPVINFKLESYSAIPGNVWALKAIADKSVKSEFTVYVDAESAGMQFHLKMSMPEFNTIVYNISNMQFSNQTYRITNVTSSNPAYRCVW